MVARVTSDVSNPRPPIVRPQRLVRLFPVGVGIGLFIASIVFSITNWTLEDMDAYWDAATRLRAGEPLYREYADPTVANVYRYAPWFAFLWVPLTFLPKMVVATGWSVLLLAAVGAVLLPLVRDRTPAALAAAGLLGSFLLTIASVGNVHPLLIAALVFGLDRRSGPLWIAATASLKAVPIVFVLVYAARREWARVIATGVLTLLLIAPMLLFDLSHYPTDPGELSYSFYNRLPVLWAASTAVLVGIAVLVAARRSRFAWLGMSIAVVAALPRTFGYDFTFVLAGLAGAERRKTR